MDGYGAYGPSSRTSSALARTHRAQQAERAGSPSYPLSPLLQERLERLRRAENDRASAQSSTEMLAPSTSSRSPSSTDNQRPRSSGESEPVKPKKGLGAKEMEQTLSTLHKQNFDLKLELYHRRERQAALEGRVERLEREAKERAQLNDALMKELEKRDKAVEDAIGMILALEKRVEQLLLERKMVRQVEADGAVFPRIDSSSVTPAPNRTPTSGTVPFGDVKTPTRMPSFVSERSEKFENLKSAYLGAGDSVLSLPRMLGDTPDTVRMDPRLASPALSDLSESSFCSVYGRGKPVGLSSPPPSSPCPCDGSSRNPVLSPESPTRIGTATPSQHRPPSSRAASGQFHNIGDVLDTAASPPQQMEKLGFVPASPENSLRPVSGQRDKERPLSACPATSQGQPKTKTEKREALERVLTHGHFSSPHTLPPTPDTFSSTTPPHIDTPSKQESPDNKPLCLLHETAPSRTESYGERRPPSQVAQAVSTTMLNDRRQAHNGRGGRSTLPVAPQGSQQPRSAHGTKAPPAYDGYDCGGGSSGRRHHIRTGSTASSVDTWLRESLKPESLDVLDPMSSVSQARGSMNNGRVSPDLFSFPTSTSGWVSHAMFGVLGGQGYMGAGGRNASATPIADTMGAIDASVPPPPLMGTDRSTPTLGTRPHMPPPPTPNRRSSLLAKTGITTDVTSGIRDVSQSPIQPSSPPLSHVRAPALSKRVRSNSTNLRHFSRHLTELGLKQDRAMTVPPKEAHRPPPANYEIPGEQDPASQALPRQRHYPPTASQSSRPRSRGLNSFFRRSTGSAETPQPPAPPASAPPAQMAFKPPPIGIPSWVRRNSLADDERSSGATPPPISRNRASRNEGGVGTANDDDGGVTLEASPAPMAAGGGVLVSTEPGCVSSAKRSRKSWGGTSGEGAGSGGVPLANPVSSSGGGGKKKWLGLRVSSLRNRGA